LRNLEIKHFVDFFRFKVPNRIMRRTWLILKEFRQAVMLVGKAGGGIKSAFSFKYGLA
jgi:hypothetical protein